MWIPVKFYSSKVFLFEPSKLERKKNFFSKSVAQPRGKGGEILLKKEVQQNRETKKESTTKIVGNRT